MSNVWWDLSKNVSLKFLAQLLLKLLIKEWRNVAVKPDFMGTISIFLKGRNSWNTWPILLKFGTVVSLPDVNWHLKFEQNWRWSGFWHGIASEIGLKIAKKENKCCLSGFPAFASYWAILWKKLHFLPEVNIFSPIRPTNTCRPITCNTDFFPYYCLRYLKQHFYLNWSLYSKHRITSLVLNHTTRPTCAYRPYTLKEIVEYYKSHSTSVYICFMDASKAFDRVNHWTLFKKMIDSGMPPIFVRLIVTWYCEQHACVRWGSTLSPKFNVSNGVRQGGILSPLFFNLYMDRLSVTLSKTKVGCALGKIMVNHLA